MSLVFPRPKNNSQDYGNIISSYGFLRVCIKNGLVFAHSINFLNWKKLCSTTKFSSNCVKVHIQFFSLQLQDTIFRIVQLQQHYIKQGKCEQGPRNDKQFTITDFLENKNFGPIFFSFILKILEMQLFLRLRFRSHCFYMPMYDNNMQDLCTQIQIK